MSDNSQSTPTIMGKCPLSDEDCATLTEVLRSCHNTTCLIDQLEKLGLDTSQFRARNDIHKTFAAGAKATFFPDRS